MSELPQAGSQWFFFLATPQLNDAGQVAYCLASYSSCLVRGALDEHGNADLPPCSRRTAFCCCCCCTPHTLLHCHGLNHRLHHTAVHAPYCQVGCSTIPFLPGNPVTMTILMHTLAWLAIYQNRHVSEVSGCMLIVCQNEHGIVPGCSAWTSVG